MVTIITKFNINDQVIFIYQISTELSHAVAKPQITIKSGKVVSITATINRKGELEKNYIVSYEVLKGENKTETFETVVNEEDLHLNPF